MSNVIDFLEKVGQDASLRRASRENMELALSDADLAPEVENAILSKNQAQLEGLMGQAPLCAVYFPGKEDEEQDDETEETPFREPEEGPEHSALRAMDRAS